MCGYFGSRTFYFMGVKMKTMLLIGIICCVGVLIGVLIHAIKNESLNLPEIIIGVTAAILSVLLAFLFNGDRKENKENTLNISSTDLAITTTVDNDKIVSSENSNEPTTEWTTEQNNSSSAESVNNSETAQTPQDLTSTEITITTKPTESDTPQQPQPIPIKTLILKSSSESYNISQTEFDPRGKMYTNVIRLDSSAVNGIGYRGKLELYTERKYSTFSCSFVPEANYSTNSGAGAYIEIYKDDVLAYTSNLITYKTTAIDVNLDIQNVEYLKIKIINVNKNYPYMANADTLLCNAFVME